MLSKKILSSSITLLLTGTLVMPVMADSSKVMTKPDESWISLSGTVTTAGDEAFRLDYGEGLITVEMDDWDWYDEGELLRAGDEVRVYGRIDDDLYEFRKIEASSVYVKDLNTHFYASAADEEGDVTIDTYTFVVPHLDGSTMNVSGTVKKVDGREFILDTGGTEIQIDTITMNYNPLDDEGFQKIDKGDRVSVSGIVDLDFFEKNELQAETIVTLQEDKSKSSS